MTQTVVRFLVVATSLIGARPAPVAACSAPPCWPGYFVPASGAVIPANTPALVWSPMRAMQPADIGKVSFTEMGGSARSFGVTQSPSGFTILSLTNALVDGKMYRLLDRNECANNAGPAWGATAPDVLFTAGPAAPLPTSLGTLSTATQRGPLEIATTSGSCSMTVDAAQASVELQPSASVKPWLPLLMVTTFVNGQAWQAARSILSTTAPGSSWVGRGKDLIYSICATSGFGTPMIKGLGVGSHKVHFEATLPGTTLSLSTPPVWINLQCSTEQPLPDHLRPDARVGLDAGVDSPPPHLSAPPRDLTLQPGCSMAGRPGLQAMLLVLLLLVLGVASVLRRRS